MTAEESVTAVNETEVSGVIRVRLWAAARAAAGAAAVEVPAEEPLTLATLVERVLAGRPERLRPVLAGCSVLLGDQPVATRDPAEVLVSPGQTVEFLPPFAGG